MLFGKSKAKNALCNVCSTVVAVIGVLAGVASLAALAGVYMSHFLSEGLTFGTAEGSLALMALGFNLFVLKKASDACGCQWAPSSKK